MTIMYVKEIDRYGEKELKQTVDNKGSWSQKSEEKGSDTCVRMKVGGTCIVTWAGNQWATCEEGNVKVRSSSCLVMIISIIKPSMYNKFHVVFC